jgi:hypothetical protein
MFPRTVDIPYLPTLQTLGCIRMLTSWHFVVVDSTPNPFRHRRRYSCICNMCDVSKYSSWWLPYHRTWLCRGIQLYHLSPHNRIVVISVLWMCACMQSRDRIQSHATTNPDPVTLSKVLSGLKCWQNQVSSLIIFHVEAVWQVYRADTESAQRSMVSSVVAIFTWWYNAMQCRIHNDFYNTRKVNRLERFVRPQSSIRCQWSAYDSSGEGRAPSVTFHPLYAIPHRPESNK